MTFPGIKDEQARADLIAYLKSVPASGAAEAGAPGRQMGGMMGARPAPNLKKLDPEDRVEAITYCGDTYPGQDGRWENARVLGAQPAPQDGFERRRSAEGRAGDRCRRDDGRPGIAHLRDPGRDQRVNQAAMPMTDGGFR
jgi:hypothetical protein